MNILILSAVFPPEPIVSSKLSFDIANALSEKNAVTVLSPKPSRPFGFQFKSDSLNFKFEHIHSNTYTCPSSSIIGRFRESYSFGKCIYNYITANHKNIDIIYANVWALFSQYYVVKTAKKYNVPIVIHVQDIYPESLTNKIPVIRPLINLLWLPIDKYVLRNSTKVIAISDKMKMYLVNTRNLETKKVSVVQNWQDEELFIRYDLHKESIQKNGMTFTFMYLGNIGPVAGVELLIDAFSMVKIENCRLVIAGSGSMKELLEKKVKDLVNNNIEFWDVPDGKVPEIQSYADIMILPIKKGSASSSVPSKLPAYMFSKKPIIACVDSDSDTASAINSANCGWVLAPEDSVSLSEKMEYIASLSTEVLEEKGENGFKYALTNYSKKNNLLKLTTIIMNS